MLVSIFMPELKRSFASGTSEKSGIACYGYRKDKRAALIINEREAEGLSKDGTQYGDGLCVALREPIREREQALSVLADHPRRRTKAKYYGETLSGLVGREDGEKADKSNRCHSG